MMYLLLLLANATLPWINYHSILEYVNVLGGNQKKDFFKIKKMKKEMKPRDLICRKSSKFNFNFTGYLLKLLDYVYSLKYEEDPDY